MSDTQRTTPYLISCDGVDRYGNYRDGMFTVPSWRKREVRRAERAALRRAMERGDYDAPAPRNTRNARYAHDAWVIG